MEQMDKAVNNCLIYSQQKNDSTKKLFEENLQLIKNELVSESGNRYFNRELSKLDVKKLLSSTDFDSTTAITITKFLTRIKDYYGDMQRTATESMDSLIFSYKEDSTKHAELNSLKDNHYNEYLADFVKNVNIKERTVIANNRIVQQIDPIFHIPSNISGIVDYRAHFFAPMKHFMGRYFDTYKFNTSVIWIMTIFLYISLYFDWLSKLVHFGSGIQINLGISEKVSKMFKQWQASRKKKKEALESPKSKKTDKVKEVEKVEKVDAETTE
jgi:ABC transport system ATP-binding/permease protein